MEKHKKLHHKSEPCKIDFASIICESDVKNKHYRCQVCAIVFDTYGHLRAHINAHCGKFPYRCTLCRTNFFSQQELRQHTSFRMAEQGVDRVIIVTGNKQFECNHCHKRFAVPGCLSEHGKTCKRSDRNLTDSPSTIGSESDINKNQKIFECQVCGIAFDRQCHVKDHLKVHSGKYPYRCTLCRKNFPCQLDLQQHVRFSTTEQGADQAPNITGLKPFECNVCLKRFALLGCLAEHAKTCKKSRRSDCKTESFRAVFESDIKDKRFECQLCGIVFDRQCHLNAHIPAHDGKFPNRCTLCRKNFSTLQELREHTSYRTAEDGTDDDAVSVSGSKQYECNLCHKQYMLPGCLAEHMETHERSCRLCGMNFTHRSSLVKHMWTHSDENRFRCQLCDKQFTRKETLQNHVRFAHTKEKLFSCSICDRDFCNQSKLCLHLRRHLGDMPYQCETCEKKFATGYQLRSHMLVHTGYTPYVRLTDDTCNKDVKEFICPECSKKFSRLQYLRMHIRYVHLGKNKVHKCPHCEKRFARPHYLRIHKLTHVKVKPYICLMCNRHFPLLYKLKRHMITHTDVKAYSCKECDKSFALYNGLWQHMRQVHDDGKNYVCDLCGKRFTRPSQMQMHIQKCSCGNTSINKVDVYPYLCPECNSGFKHPDELVQHCTKCHSGSENVHQCIDCGQSYRTSKLLYSHRLRHGERSYMCLMCDKAFFTRKDLGVHLDVHSGTKRFECHHCKQTFNRASSLQRHVVHMHDAARQNKRSKIIATEYLDLLTAEIEGNRDIGEMTNRGKVFLEATEIHADSLIDDIKVEVSDEMEISDDRLFETCDPLTVVEIEGFSDSDGTVAVYCGGEF